MQLPICPAYFTAARMRSVAKKPDAGEREGMPLTVANMCYERQLLARPADPGR